MKPIAFPGVSHLTVPGASARNDVGVRPAFSNSSGLKNALGKPSFRDGLLWMVGLTVEIKVRFQISPA